MKELTFEQKKELLELEYNLHMKEIEASNKSEKEIENIKFDHQLQLQRIKSSEIKKSMDRKRDLNFMENYPK
jgi:hypothetical protein